jgi:hypothetical protein
VHFKNIIDRNRPRAAKTHHILKEEVRDDPDGARPDPIHKYQGQNRPLAFPAGHVEQVGFPVFADQTRFDRSGAGLTQRAVGNEFQALVPQMGAVVRHTPLEVSEKKLKIFSPMC